MTYEKERGGIAGLVKNLSWCEYNGIKIVIFQWTFNLEEYHRLTRMFRTSNFLVVFVNTPHEVCVNRLVVEAPVTKTIVAEEVAKHMRKLEAQMQDARDDGVRICEIGYGLPTVAAVGKIKTYIRNTKVNNKLNNKEK